ncbi:hypothetical protein [Streptomyces sp. NPDC006638]|uniref:hypothetical protein n=1 Tax=Streptomyces sp. NPDC006638 TaxID=3157183 RepID=UPI0033BD9DB0
MSESSRVYALTITSRSGKKVNIITGADHDTITVYGDDDLRRRLAVAADNPDFKVTYRLIK